MHFGRSCSRRPRLLELFKLLIKGLCIDACRLYVLWRRNSLWRTQQLVERYGSSNQHYGSENTFAGPLHGCMSPRMVRYVP
jgi:hypothetical protein